MKIYSTFEILSEEQRVKTIYQIGESFGYPPQHSSSSPSILIDFATLFSPKNKKNNHILYDSKNSFVVSHVGVVLKILTYQGHSIPVAIIGGVWCHENFRGQNIPSQLLQHVHSLYQSQVAFFILWSDKNHFFERLDYSLSVGQVTNYNPKRVFEKNSKRIPKRYRELPLEELKDYWPQILNLYLQQYASRCVHIHRDFKNWEEYCKITSSQIYVEWGERKNNFQKIEKKIERYFVMNKGLDMPQCIYEFGGYPDLHSDEFQELTKIAHVFYPELGGRDKEILGQEAATQYLAFFKLGNFSIFQKFIDFMTRGYIRLVGLEEKDLVIFSLLSPAQGNSLSELRECRFGEFLCLLFGPYPAKELLCEENSLIRSNSIFISAWDSF